MMMATLFAVKVSPTPEKSFMVDTMMEPKVISKMPHIYVWKNEECVLVSQWFWHHSWWVVNQAYWITVTPPKFQLTVFDRKTYSVCGGK